jgi:predicted ATP-grasp superfamily ATP-dependent carboligase
MPSQSKNFYDLVVTIAEEEDYNLENLIRQALKFFNNLGEGGASIKPDPAFAEDGTPTICSVDVRGNTRQLHQSSLYPDMSSLVEM